MITLDMTDMKIRWKRFRVISISRAMEDLLFVIRSTNKHLAFDENISEHLVILI